MLTHTLKIKKNKQPIKSINHALFPHPLVSCRPVLYCATLPLKRTHVGRKKKSINHEVNSKMIENKTKFNNTKKEKKQLLV